MNRLSGSLSQYTTFKLGGTAKYFVSAHSEEQLKHALRGLNTDEVLLLGGGSNLLVNDAPLDATVIAVSIPGVTVKEHPDGVQITAGAGVDWDTLVSHAVDNGWQGIECLSGIPGHIGAAPVQNIGAYGQCIADTLLSVRALDRQSGEFVELSKAECGFDYRKSMFQTRPMVITEVTLLLKPGGPPTLTYQDLRSRFHGRSPTLAEIRDAVLHIRGAKGALAMDGFPRLRCAGSFFKNPVVDHDTFHSFREMLERDDISRRWYWPQGEDSMKVAAGRLIEGAGFKRGYRDGPVGNSPYHSLTLVAYDGATAEDVVGLARRIQELVLREFRVILNVEPRLWGWKTYPLLRPDLV